jgi:ribonuclease R
LACKSRYPVNKVLGNLENTTLEIHAILAEYGLPSEFPIEVETLTKKIDTSITEIR